MNKKIIISMIFCSMALFGAEESIKEQMEKFAIKENSDDFSFYQERRVKLVKKIKAAYPDVKDGVVALFGNFEPDVRAFEQERHFFI